MFFNKCQPFPKQTLIFTCLWYKAFENTVGKGELAHNEPSTIYIKFNCCLQTL